MTELLIDLERVAECFHIRSEDRVEEGEGEDNNLLRGACADLDMKE